MKHLVPVALVVLLLAIAGDRWWARRSLALLTMEQKARLMDASLIGNVWPLACLAAAVAMISWLPPRLIPAPYVSGFLTAFILTVFLVSVAATASKVIRVSRLGLPQAYTRSVAFRALVFVVALFLLVCAVIYDASAYIRRRGHAVQSSNQSMKLAAGSSAINF